MKTTKKKKRQTSTDFVIRCVKSLRPIQRFTILSIGPVPGGDKIGTQYKIMVSGEGGEEKIFDHAFQGKWDEIEEAFKRKFGNWCRQQFRPSS